MEKTKRIAEKMAAVNQEIKQFLRFLWFNMDCADIVWDNCLTLKINNVMDKK